MFDPARLREVMAAQGRRADWLAEQTGYTAERVSRFRTGAVPISDKFAALAAEAMGISIDELRAQETANAA